MAEEKVAKTRSPKARKVTDVEAAPEEAHESHFMYKGGFPPAETHFPPGNETELASPVHLSPL